MEAKKLYRSKKDKVIAGVCGGIAEYFNVDPVWVRLVAVLFVLLDGVGVVIYILAWILIPENPAQKSTIKTTAEKAVDDLKRPKRNASAAIGLIIIVLGAGLLFRNIFPGFNFHLIWPVAIIILGVFLIGGKNEKK